VDCGARDTVQRWLLGWEGCICCAEGTVWYQTALGTHPTLWELLLWPFLSQTLLRGKKTAHFSPSF